MEFTGENQIYETVFSLTNAALSGRKIDRDAYFDVDFLKLYETAAKHAIVTEFEAVFSDLPMKEEEEAVWENSILYQIQKFGALRDEQKKIYTMFNFRGISFAVLKGFAASMYYPKPFQRMHGDVDLLLKEEQIEEACALLEKEGYERHSDGFGRHEEMKKGEFSVELHRRYSDEENDAFGPEIDEILSAGLESAVLDKVDGV